MDGMKMTDECMDGMKITDECMDEKLLLNKQNGIDSRNVCMIERESIENG